MLVRTPPLFVLVNINNWENINKQTNKLRTDLEKKRGEFSRVKNK